MTDYDSYYGMAADNNYGGPYLLVYQQTAPTVAKFVGIIRLQKNVFTKYSKKSYEIIGTTDTTITLHTRKYRSSPQNAVCDRLTPLLRARILDETRVPTIIDAVHTIANDKSKRAYDGTDYPL